MEKCVTKRHACTREQGTLYAHTYITYVPKLEDLCVGGLWKGDVSHAEMLLRTTSTILGISACVSGLWSSWLISELDWLLSNSDSLVSECSWTSESCCVAICLHYRLSVGNGLHAHFLVK